MARRRDYIDPMAFVNQQQQGGGGLKDLASLMALLGLGAEQEGEGATRETQAKSQQSQQAWYEGQIAQQQAAGGRAEQELADRRAEAKAAGEERLAAAALRKLQEQELIDTRNRDIQYKEDTLAQAVMEKALEGVTDPKERQAIIGNFNPRAAAAFQKGEEAKKAVATGKFKKGLEQTYKTAGEKGRPGDVAKYLETQKAIPGMEEIMQDPSIEWQALNQGMPAAQPGWLSRMFGGGSERERAVAAAAKVAPPAVAGEASVSPSVVPAAPRPMAFTGYEPVVEGPIRRGYGAVPEGTVGGPALPELLSKALGLAAPPSTGRGYYTPNAPIVEAPVAPPVDKVMEVAGVTDRNAAAPFVSTPGGPSAMPGVVQQPGFLENFLKQISDYGASRPERVPAERYPYPIGHGVPPPMGGPIDPRLLQP